jgi:hypothetical protein
MASTGDFSAVRCVGGALSYIFGNFRDFLILATPPVIGLAIIESLLQLAVPTGPMEPGTMDPAAMPQAGGAALLAVIAMGILNLVFYVMFAVAWHRKYLLPQETMTVAKALRWRREKTRFLMLLILLGLIGFGIAMLGSFAMPALMMLGGAMGSAIIPIGTVLIALAVLVVFARLSLVFPAASIGMGDFGIGDAWRASKGKALGMFLILLLPAIIAVLASLPVLLIALVFGSTGLMQTLTGYAVIALIGQALNYFAIALAVSSLSAAFCDLTGYSPA